MNYRNQNKPPVVPKNFGIGKRLSLDNEMDRNVGSRRTSSSTPRRQALSPVNVKSESLVGSSESEAIECDKRYTKEEVDELLRERYKGKKGQIIDWKGKIEWMTEYIKRMKTCVKSFQKALEDALEEKDSLRKMLDSSERNCLQTEIALKSKEEEFKVTVSKLETNIFSLNECLAKEESEKKDALNCLVQEKESRMALEKNRDSLRKELGWAEQNVLNAAEKVKVQQDMSARLHEYNNGLQKYNTQLQDELREASRANKQVESEKAAILQELSTLRAQYTMLQREFNAAKIDVSR